MDWPPSLLALLFMLFLFTGIFSKGYTAFLQTQIRLTVDLASVEFPASVEDIDGFYAIDYAGLIKNSLYASFPGSRQPARQACALPADQPGCELLPA